MDASDSTRTDLTPAACAFLFGTLCLSACPSIPDVRISSAVGCVALVGLLARHRHAARLLIWACCGFLFSDASAYRYLDKAWPWSAGDERVRAEVVVESIPELRGGDWSFDVKASILAPRSRRSTMRIRILSRDAHLRPRAGERWLLLISLRPPRTSLNPGAMDYERMLFHESVHALGTIVESRLNQRLDIGERPLASVRERIARHIEERVADRDAAGLIAALAVGATGSMSREQWRVFNATGTTHLVAISGLHVTLFAVVMFSVARQLWSLLLWRWISWNRESFAAIVGLSAATAYAMLAGLSIPTQRTLIMLAAWLFARCVARNTSTLQPFAVALLAVLILDPFAPLTAGFWLSFAAMGAILLVTGTRLSPRDRLQEAVAVQLAVAIVLAPLTLACFGSVSVLGPIINAAAIPYMSWLLVPVVLLGVALLPLSTWAADHVFALAEWLHNLAWPWLATAADTPFALAYASPTIWWYLLALLAIPLAFAPWPTRIRLATAICVLPLVSSGHGAPAPGELEMTVLDMGEGSSTVLRSARHTLVYGTGESYGTGGNRAETLLVPFLRSSAIRRVDRLVVQQLTSITGGGVTALLAAMPVSRTSVGGSASVDFAGAGPCRVGETWTWDGLRFRILESCELDVYSASGRVRLTTGTAAIEDLRGSTWAVISGRSVRNGKPRAAFARAAQLVDHVLATGESGAVRIDMTLEGEVTVRGQRQENPALWRSPAGPPH